MERYVLDWRTCGSVERLPGRAGDDWVFRDTRVLVAALFTNLEGGATVDEFLEWFPEVKREQVNGVIEHAVGSLEVPHSAQSDEEALKAIQHAFSGCPRPEHFTSYNHCDECEQHDDLFRSRDIHTLTLKDVSASGTTCFLSPEGFVYYFPALARLALEEPTESGWYGCHLLFHLSSESHDERISVFTAEQRQAILAFLYHLLETRRAVAALYLCENNLFKAIACWSGEPAPPSGG
jgi:uncharacterized protein (DUF433 family)